MKRTATDDWFSKCVRERTDWYCEYCDRNFSHNKGELHCSHVYGRRANRVRWEPLNAMAHCAGCHRKLGEQPLEFARHYIEKRGEGARELLTEKWNDLSIKYSKKEQTLISKHYREELRRMEKLRAGGMLDIIEFVGY